MRTTKRKVVALKKLLGLRRGWKSKGLAVVFTNGVFDILHPGHIHILEKSKALGDRLIVGVNTDASARRLGKGPDRPINKLAARMRVLAALACADAVVPFGEDTPERIVSKLRPDVLVKGADYRPDEVAGRKHAGRVVLVPIKPGHSTTRLVGKIRKKR